MGIPCKTAAGHAELAIRQRGLSQRHRTLLFLVDGRRTLNEVIELGLQAGVPKGYIDELLALGLVVMGAPVQPPPMDGGSPAPAMAPIATIGRGSGTVEPSPADVLRPVPVVIGRRDDDHAVDELSDDGADADTRLIGLPLSNTELAALDEGDEVVAQARRLLMQVLRAHGPVTTAMTMLRVRRARDRATLLALVPEIRQRLMRLGASTDALDAIDDVHALLSA